MVFDKDWLKGGGYGLTFSIPIIPGTLWLGEIFSVLLLAIFFLNGLVGSALKKYRLLKLVISLLALWLLGQVITDIAVESDYYDLARGWLKIILLGICLTSVVCFLSNGSRVAGFLSSLLFVFLSNLMISQYLGSLEGLWKFGMARPTLYLIAIIPLFFNYGVVKIFFWFVFVGGVSFTIFATRSYALIAFLVAIMIFLTNIKIKHNYFQNIQLVRNLNAMMLVLVFLLAAGFGDALSQQLMVFWDDRQVKKIEEQGAISLNILLSSRPEFISASKAISDSPVIGHGSWARDYQYYEYMLGVLEEAGKIVSVGGDPMRIPSHSHILGSWVESGITGGVFWGGVLVVAFFNAINIGRIYTPYRAIVALFSVFLIWDIIFSPYGGDRKFINAIFLAVPMVVYKNYNIRREK